MLKGKKVIVAPLDWGLGHATRCIPLIRECILNGAEVILISSGRSLALLQKEFPSLRSYDVPAYNIYYQKTGSFVLKIVTQLSKIFRGIKQEHRALKIICENEKPHLIIADNRYGMYHKHLYSILITHQIMVKFPSFKIIEWGVHLWLRKKHNRFNEVWIPDVAGTPNISGDLSHKYKLPDNTKYIGILTRFDVPASPVKITNDILIIMSGPEPQRTLFEEMILEQMKSIHRKCILISGTSERKSDIFISQNIRLISFCTAEELFELVNQSHIIISRGGYSTLMDLAHLNKKCIFIPTPGQTEQEYLVKQLQKENLAFAVSQKQFNLKTALEKVELTKGFYISADRKQFAQHIKEKLLM